MCCQEEVRNLPQTSQGQSLHVCTVHGPNFATHFVSGLWGGIGPTGDLVVYLYHDAVAVPSGFNLQVDSGNRVTAEVPEEEPREYTRTVETKLIIPPSAARNLGAWLLQSADAADAIMRQVLAGGQGADANP